MALVLVVGGGLCLGLLVLSLFHNIRCLVGHAISSLLLAFVVLIAYWQLYVRFVDGRWWRVDLAIWRCLMASEPELGADDVLKLREAASTPGVRHSLNAEFYIEDHGYDHEQHRVTTEDGFILHCHRIFKKEKLDPSLPPILLQHGLFQSAGIFVTSEEESMAFYFAEKGYDVWVGNNRCIHEPGHVKLRPSDEGYWNWGLDELGRFDFPAFIDYVCKISGHEKVVFVGHSQGNAQAFVGLALSPHLSQKISLFVALAPAFYIGRLGHWALETMASMPSLIFYQLFGKHSFIPIMYVVQRLMPPRAFGHLAYNMFNYLFHWSDTYWRSWRKSKYFLFTPRPVSSRLVHHWGEITKRGQLKPYTVAHKESNINNSAAYDEQDPKQIFYSLSCIGCPVAVFYGGKDKLVLGRALVENLQANKKINLVYHREIEHYEHMDVVWGYDAREHVFEPVDEIMRGSGKLSRA